MSPGPFPRVVVASPAQAQAARRLRLTALQAGYAGDIALNVDTAMAAPHSDAMAVLLDDTVIGFYRLDYPTVAVAARATDWRWVLLRAFALDLAWQGRGLGLPVLAACCADVSARHPARTQLALYVHARNTVAMHLYRRAGFTEAGETLRGGPGGPEHLMLRALGVGQCAP